MPVKGFNIIVFVLIGPFARMQSRESRGLRCLSDPLRNAVNGKDRIAAGLAAGRLSALDCCPWHLFRYCAMPAHRLEWLHCSSVRALERGMCEAAGV